MIALIQRVSHASVEVDSVQISNIEKGLLVLLGIEKGDDEAKADKLVRRIMGYRVFEDDQGKMNLSVLDINGGVLLVPQFTLAADTQKGMRPSFSKAAPPQEAEDWFNRVAEKCEGVMLGLQRGQFAADMKVELLNDGPVTFWLQS